MRRTILSILIPFIFLCGRTASGNDNRGMEESLEKALAYIDTDPDSALILSERILSTDDGRAGEYYGKFLSVKANALFAKGESHEAIRVFRQAQAAAKAAGDMLTVASVLSDMGVAYRITDRSDSALVCYRGALDILEEMDQPAEMASLLTSIAVLFANQGRLDDAIPYARRAFSCSRRSDDIESIMYAGQTLGIVLYLAGHKEEGLSVEREMVTIAERRKMPRYILKTYASIIDMHHKEGNRDSVDCYIERGRQLLPMVPEGSVEAMGFLEESYVVLTASGRYAESLEIQKKLLAMRDAGGFMPLDKLYQRMARNYRGLGDIERMGEAYEKSIALADSIHGDDVQRQLSEFDVKYQTARKELEISRLQAEESRHRSYMIILLSVSLIIIAGGIVFWYVRSQSLRKRAEIARMQATLDGVEQERIRLATELHDGVCNDLAGVRFLLESPSADRKEILRIIGSMRDEVRQISHALMPPKFETLSFGQLMDDFALKSDGLVCYREISEVKCDPLTSHHLYRIVQEWVDNIRHHSDATSVIVTVSGNTLEIEDNGKPLAKSGGRGIGQETVAGRVKVIGATMERTFSDDGNLLKITFKN